MCKKYIEKSKENLKYCQKNNIRFIDTSIDRNIALNNILNEIINIIN